MAIKMNTLIFCVVEMLALFIRFGDGGVVRSSTQYSVEILVVMDPRAYQQWYATTNGSTHANRTERTSTAVNNYVHALFAGMNVVMSSLSIYGVKLDVRILNIVLAQTTVTPSAKKDIVQGLAALAEFRGWLRRHGYYRYDHALLLTGYTVTDGTNLKAEGIAYMGTMCAGSSVSVVESKPNQNAVLTAVHELGHSLNASHDGVNNPCSLASGHVMRAVRSGTSSSRWRFSVCSALSIKRLMSHIADWNDCLSPRKTSARAVRSKYLGQLYSPDELCQMLYGGSSYVCRSLYDGDAGDYSKLCAVIWCYSGGNSCTTVVGTDGVVCGHRKRCLAGKCITFTDGPSDVSDTCPLGDSPMPVSGSSRCSDVLRASTRNCRSPYFHKTCCGSCETIFTGNPACPYGDSIKSCKPYYCMLGYAAQCCATCRR